MLRHREGSLTVSFFLLKTGMATVVRSIRPCASEVKSCRGGERRDQRGSGLGCQLVPYSGSVRTPTLSTPLTGRGSRRARGGWEDREEGQTGFTSLSKNSLWADQGRAQAQHTEYSTAQPFPEASDVDPRSLHRMAQASEQKGRHFCTATQTHRHGLGATA